MMDRHIRDVIGHIPVDKLDYRHLNHWVMMKRYKAPKTIQRVHGLISAAMNTAEMQLTQRHPCRGVPLPNMDKAEGEVIFLTQAALNMILEGIGERYKTLTSFLVVTGARFGEATALKVADYLCSPNRPRCGPLRLGNATVSHFLPRGHQDRSGKRTTGLNPALVDLGATRGQPKR